MKKKLWKNQYLHYYKKISKNINLSVASKVIKVENRLS